MRRRMDLPLARRRVAIGGCGTTTDPKQPGAAERLPVYDAGKLLGYCHGELVGSEWRVLATPFLPRGVDKHSTHIV